MAHAASLHTHGGAVGCVVDGWRSYGCVVGGAGVVYGVAGCWRYYGGVVGGVVDGWRSYGCVVDDMACCKLAHSTN